MNRASIVIPHYNSARYLHEAVASALGQSVPVEVVVVDDGSTSKDAPAALASAERAGAIVLRKPNGGVSSARNAGIAAASAPYIICLDADDRLEPDIAERAAALLDADADLAIVCWAQRLFGDEQGVRPCDYTGPASMLANTTIPNTSMFRRADWQQAGGYPEELAVGEDWAFWMRILRQRAGVRVLAEVGSWYRISRHQVTRRVDPLQVAAASNLVLRENPDLYPTDLLTDELARLRVQCAHYRRNYRIIEQWRTRARTLRDYLRRSTR